MAEKRELENLSCAAMKHAAQARACLEMALEITERRSDEHLVAFVDGSYFPPNGCKVKTRGKG